MLLMPSSLILQKQWNRLLMGWNYGRNLQFLHIFEFTSHSRQFCLVRLALLGFALLQFGPFLRLSPSEMGGGVVPQCEVLISMAVRRHSAPNSAHIILKRHSFEDWVRGWTYKKAPDACWGEFIVFNPYNLFYYYAITPSGISALMNTISLHFRLFRPQNSPLVDFEADEYH